MNPNKYWAILLGLLILLSACDDDKVSTGFIKPATYYPMSIGSEWIYDREIILKKYESDTSNIIIDIDTLIFTDRVWIDKDTILNDTMNVKVFKSQEAGNNWTSEQYMFLDNEGLKCYAYKNAGGPTVFLKNSIIKSKTISLPFNGFEPMLLKQTDSIILEPTPRLNIKLPLVLGSKWTYLYPNLHLNLQIDKEIIGFENIAINNNSFSCYKILWKYLNNPAFEGINIIDWVSYQGLIKRQIIYNRTVFTDEQGHPMGYVQNTETILIKEMKLK